MPRCFDHWSFVQAGKLSKNSLRKGAIFFPFFAAYATLGASATKKGPVSKLPVFAAIALVVLALDCSPAAAKRVAFVIGNADYKIAPLNNTVNDAQLVASRLAELSFDVKYLTNARKEEFIEVFERSKTDIANAEVFLLYYAGHALQYNGDNLLLMTDVSKSTEKDVVESSYSLMQLMRKIGELKPGVAIIALDSCRDTPIAQANKAFQSGLSYVESSSQEMLIGYATSAGQVAYDGVGKNGPYAIALANALSSPEVVVSDVFRQVRRHVREATIGAQIPWVSSSIEDEIVLRSASPIETPVTKNDSDWLDLVSEIVWRYIGESGKPRYYSLFASLFPKSGRAQLAMDSSATSITRDLKILPFETAPSIELDVGDTSVPSGEYGTTVDRNPISEMRFWPERLPEVEEGLSTLVTRCDLLVGDPDDPAGVTPGRHMALVSTRDAIAECGFEIARSPNNTRIMFQFARALDIAGEVQQAIIFYEMAARGGYSQAMVNLGHLYRFGVKVPVDYKKAFNQYKHAAQIGNPQARMGLAILYGNGWGITKSTEESLLWARLAGSQGWLNAYDMLATHFATGKGVEKNVDVAFTLLLYASQMGQTNAMSNLGLAYLKGEGVKKNESLGLQWLNRANEAGNRYAAYHLAKRVLDSNPAEAERLLNISADRDFPQARIDLAQLYESRQLYDEAYFQARLAQRLGYKRNLDELSARLKNALSPADLVRVSKRVDQWMRDNGY